MSEKTVADRIRELLVSQAMVDARPSDIRTDTRLIEELGLDSVRIIELIAAIEEEFGIVLEDEELDLAVFRTLGTLSGFVAAKSAAADRRRGEHRTKP